MKRFIVIGLMAVGKEEFDDGLGLERVRLMGICSCTFPYAETDIKKSQVQSTLVKGWDASGCFPAVFGMREDGGDAYGSRGQWTKSMGREVLQSLRNFPGPRRVR